MNFDKKYFTRSALLAAALMFAGCATGTPSVSAEEPVSAEVVEKVDVVEKTETAEKTVVPTTAPADEEKAEATPEAATSEREAELKRISKETEKLQLARSLIESRLGLANSEYEKTQAALQLEKMKLDSARATFAAELEREIVSVEEERIELERKLAFEAARANAALRDKHVALEKLELELREIQAKMNAESLRVKHVVSIAEKETQLAKIAPVAAQSPMYLKEPFVDGTLYISDRRIELNGPIVDSLAKTVCDQIYFYDNQNSEYPIFIVIENSPGGSVSAGYQIQKAMQSSKAPVYVVVKGFAASMAAVIATTAERSYCFDNTIILHHQISSVVQGNLTVMREGVAEGELWAQRCTGPVATKMGITLEEFTKQMYANNSSGDWQAIGPKAIELKWVDNLVSRVEETSVITIPEEKKPQAKGILFGEKTDTYGKRFVELPVLLDPFDFWAIYDKNNYYRAR